MGNRLEANAEANCEALITRALLLTPSPYASTLQTLASIRLSQTRLQDAQSALTRSLAQWEDLPPEHMHVPDFPTRISLARLLMEAEMEKKALDVAERLVDDDEESVEAWYLGGWCLFLMGEKEEQNAAGKGYKRESRMWLAKALWLFGRLGYEDERLEEHALELVGKLDEELGEDDEEEESEDEGWEDEEEEGEEEDEDEDEEPDGKAEGAGGVDEGGDEEMKGT